MRLILSIKVNGKQKLYSVSNKESVKYVGYGVNNGCGTLDFIKGIEATSYKV